MGQIDSIKTVTGYLNQSCKICQISRSEEILNYQSKGKNIHQLFHDLHTNFSNKHQENTLNTILQIEKAGKKYEKEMPYGYLYYFIRGVTFFDLKLYKEAIIAYEKSLDCTPYEYFKGFIWINLAVAHKDLKQYEVSLSYLSKAEKVATSHDNLKYVYSNKADINTLLRKYDESEKIHKKLIRIENKLKDSSNLILSYTNLANFYYNQYLDDKAIPLFKKALSIAKKINEPEKLRDAHYNMQAVYRNLGDYKNALIELKIYQEIKDTLNNAQRIRDLTNLEKEQEKQILAERKNNEIALIEKDNQLLTSGIFATLLILVLLFYFYVNTRQQNKVIEAQKQKVDKLNTIKDELLSVLGHDLRSPMQHLISVFDRSFKVLKKGDEQKLFRLLQHGSLAVSKTSILLDNVLQWVTQQNKQGYFQKETIAIFPLVQQVQATFLPITQMQKIELVNEVDAENTVVADRNSLKIIIRNLVDNAIKFTPENGQIRITTSIGSTGQQGIHIQDTGVGMSAKIIGKILSTTDTNADADVSGRKSTGLGLRICKGFIQRHKGELTIESVEGEGSTFSIWLPIPTSSSTSQK